MDEMADVQEVVRFLYSLETFSGKEPWIEEAAENLSRYYNNLRSYIQKNSCIWSEVDRRECLAAHYLNLVCYYGTLFDIYGNDLKNVKKYLASCTKAAGTSQTSCIEKLRIEADKIKLKVDAKHMQLMDLEDLTNGTSTNRLIPLGMINFDSLSKCSDPGIEQKVKNILLLRCINVLEDVLTVSEKANVSMVTSYLALAYALIGQTELSIQYTKAAQDVLLNDTNVKNGNDVQEKKQLMKRIISERIADYGNSLVEVKNYITEVNETALGTIDNNFIDQKYIKYCAKLWIQESIDAIKETIEAGDYCIVQEMCTLLNTVHSLNQVPSPLNTSKYYGFLRDIQTLMSKDVEDKLLNTLTKDCLERLKDVSEVAMKGLEFMDAVVGLLSSEKDSGRIITDLKLKDFCMDRISFDDVLNCIFELGENFDRKRLRTLQQAAKDLQQEKDPLLLDNFRKMANAYLMPTEVRECELDGRLVVEIQGRNVSISNHLQQIEHALSKNPAIEEVRFVAIDVLHIDADLCQEVWHGKNVIVGTSLARVYDKVVWDVSGNDDAHEFAGNAGTNKYGNGKTGKDGFPGECGGNVLLVVNDIKEPKNLTIKANGGKGSRGQNGGDGKNGEDGKGITAVEFDKKFPSVIKAFDVLERIKLHNLTLQNINSSSIKTNDWMEDHGLKGPDRFIEAITNEGNKITFSHCASTFSKQAFLLYEGSSGKPGGSGGDQGLGGQGGYAGDIQIVTLTGYKELGILKHSTSGEDGEHGKGGLYGVHGKNGWDMAYLDYQSWSKALYRGKDEQSKCTLEYYKNDNNPSTRIWCPYKDKYAEIAASKTEHRKQKKYEERKTSEHTRERQHHARAVRKKAIQQQAILGRYSHHLTTEEQSELQNLRFQLDRTRQMALQALKDNKEEQKNYTMQQEVKRTVSLAPQERKSEMFINTISSSASVEENIDIDSVMEKLKHEPTVLENWLPLRNLELSCHKLEVVFTHWKLAKENELPETFQWVEELLIQKHAFSVLHNIEKLLPLHGNAPANIHSISAEKITRYLAKNMLKEDNGISHPVLGTLNQYLYKNDLEQRENLLNFCKDDLIINNYEALKWSIQEFTIETNQTTKEPHVTVKKYYSEYKQFVESHESSMSLFFEAFESAFSQPRHEAAYLLWIESSHDKSAKNHENEYIAKDEFLCKLYNRYRNECKRCYDWENCCKDEDMLKQYYDYLRDKGSLSECFRTLLAYIYETCIRVYIENQNGMLSLHNVHNPRSHPIIHVLLKNEEIVQLNVDEDFLKLEQDRQERNEQCLQILLNVQSLKQKKDLDELLDSKKFLPESRLCRTQQSFDDDDNVIENILGHYPVNERSQLKDLLSKISSNYIGQQEILQTLSKRFSCDGKHVSTQELCFIINSILDSFLDDRKELDLFCWIVAAHPQKQWFNECLLREIENYFEKPLVNWSEFSKYLSNIENKDILIQLNTKMTGSNLVSFVTMEETLRLLSSIPNCTGNLMDLELSEWPYALKEHYWTWRIYQILDCHDSAPVAASYYALSVENRYGSSLTEALLTALGEKGKELSLECVTDILRQFHDEQWNLSKVELEMISTVDIAEWIERMKCKFNVSVGERDISRLVELIEGGGCVSEGIKQNLSIIKDIVMNIPDARSASDNKSPNKMSETGIKNWAKEFRNRSSKVKTSDTEKEMLAMIDRSIELKRGFRLRDTQKLAILALLTNKQSTLAQVSTGEGKSLIVAALAIMKALLGEKVHIVTSSSVLAKRDAEMNEDIYGLFNVGVSHNCNEDVEKRKKAYSSGQVVYGDLTNFQRDYLLDRFYQKNLLGDHNFENVIIDEVDSMLLDKGNNMLYLSHDLPSFDKLEAVYLYIWQWMNKPVADKQEALEAFNVEMIKNAVLDDIYGLIKKEDVGLVDSKLTDTQQSTIWKKLVKQGFIDDAGKLLQSSVNESSLREVLSPEFSGYGNRIVFLLKERIEREKCIHVPNYLKPFVERHLESWINSARIAYFMTPGQDYVIDVDRSGTSPDRSPNITILDRDTGTDQANSQWDEALHQFLQLKHGCKLSLQSLKAVFISNVSYFKLYRKLYGLTGTLGSTIERDLLHEMYNVEFVSIPTAKRKQFQEYKPILCSEWINTIKREATAITKDKGRSVLLICETVNDVETICKAFGGRHARNVHTYTRDYEEFSIAHDALGQGQIIIATNLAGRGTDIKITEELRQAGGLHVILTYLPGNIRIEQQAFGRAARCGDRGSGQLIIVGARGHAFGNFKVLEMKKERDLEELHRISNIKSYYNSLITAEESCFKRFQKQYEFLNQKLLKKFDDTFMESLANKARKVAKFIIPSLEKSTQKSDLIEILVQSCIDRWAFWLDKNGDLMKTAHSEQLEHSINNFISQMEKLSAENTSDLSTWVEDNPVQMVKLGKYLAMSGLLEDAVTIFDKVIECEHQFSEAAHYYKAFALAKQIDWEQKSMDGSNRAHFKNMKIELREAARLYEAHSKVCMVSAAYIGNMKQNSSENIIQIDAYEEQQKNMANCYYMFSRSIDDIFGHSVTPQSFVNNDISEDLAEFLFADLQKEGILSKPKVKKNIPNDKIKLLMSGYGISIDSMVKFFACYKGKTIVEKDFLKSIKSEVNFASRERFWRMLVDQNVLKDEVRYVIVNEEKLKALNLSIPDCLSGKREDSSFAEDGNGRIFLYGELLDQHKKNYVFRKEILLEAIGSNTYQRWKKWDVLIFNRKARFDGNVAQSTSFACFDSISLDDFAMVDIVQADAESIMTELLKLKVVEKVNELYTLKTTFDKIKEIELEYCPLYGSTVKRLLAVCFAYRLTLQKMTDQWKNKQSPIRIELMPKPHRKFVQELVNQRIVKPVKVVATDSDGNVSDILPRFTNFCLSGDLGEISRSCPTLATDLDSKIKDMYRLPATKAELKQVLSRSLQIHNQSFDDLLDHLIDKSWIIKYNPAAVITRSMMNHPESQICANVMECHNCPDESIEETEISMDGAWDVVKSVRHDLYTINASHKRDKGLNSCFKSLEEDLNHTLGNLAQLSKEDVRKYIVSTLDQSRSALITLKTPDGQLKPLVDYCVHGNFSNICEVHIFFLNGLNLLLLLEEKKWTEEMLIDTAITVGIGMASITMGTVIEVFSTGIMTHAAAVLVSEGVNDIFYAAGALRSGYFSWKEYRQHKLESIMFSVATVGVGAMFSRGAKFSRFGHELFGPGLELGGKKASEIAGATLASEITKRLGESGWKVIAKAAMQRIALKGIEAVTLGLAHAGVDMLVQNHLRGLCEGLGSVLLSEVEENVAKHNICLTLEMAYKELGEEKAKTLINQLTVKTSSDKNWVENYVPKLSKIASCITRGIAEAAKKMNSTGSKMSFPIHYISLGLIWSERAVQIYNIRTATNDFLGKLDKQINEELEKSRNKSGKKASIQPSVEDCEKFKKEFIDQWKALFRQKAGQIIECHLISPLLKEGASYLVKCMGKAIQNKYRSYKESGNRSQFEDMKRECEKELKNAQQDSNADEKKKEVTQKYHGKLLKLMTKTRNPQLFCDIIKENVPMDLTCANACVVVIHQILISQGVDVSNVSIVVQTDDGMKQTFSSGKEGSSAKIVNLNLSNNHFQLAGSNAPSGGPTQESKNNCLFDALLESNPALGGMTPDDFRARLCNCIEQDPNIQYRIFMGWHRFPISFGAVGGQRNCSNDFVDMESTEIEQTEISVHLTNRLTRYIRFLGVIQIVHEETGIPREEIVKGGKSTYQDKSNTKTVPACHVVRAGAINRNLGDDKMFIKGSSSKWYNLIRNFLGHTQNVERCANYGVGTAIDKFQSATLTVLSGVNFNTESYDDGDIQKVKTATNKFLNILETYYKKENSNAYFKNELKIAIDNIKKMDLTSLMSHGTRGYHMENMEAYKQPRRTKKYGNSNMKP